MSKRLLLCAATTGYQTRVFADAARRLGCELTLATDRCHVLDDPWADRAIAVRFAAPEHSAGQVLRRGTYDAVAAVGDRPALLAAHVAARLNVPFHPVAAVEAARNKYSAREAFQAADLPVPEYRRFPIDADPESIAAEVRFPCVLKPLGLSASRGVIRADDRPAFAAAFRRIRTLLADPDIVRFRDPADRFLQVESFIPGREFALEGIVTGGRLQVLALFDKPDPLDGPFFAETIYVTPSRAPDSVQRAIAEATHRAAAALGLSHGPIHAEMRVNPQGVWMLEVAARPIGGLCARALTFLPDFSLEELILRHALGEDISSAQLAADASGVFMIPVATGGVYQAASGIDAAAAVSGITEVLITGKQGQRVQPLPEGATYLGFLFARGKRADDVELGLRLAYSKLEFSVAAEVAAF